MADVVQEVKKLLAGALAPAAASLEVAAKPPRTTDKEHAMDSLSSMEDRLFNQSLAVIEDAMSFGDLPFDAEGPPEDWIWELGEAAAERKFRRVKAGQMKSSEAPSGVRVAEKIATGIMKTKALRGAAPVLNLSLVQLTVEAEPREYPTQIREST